MPETRGVVGGPAIRQYPFVLPYTVKWRHRSRP